MRLALVLLVVIPALAEGSVRRCRFDVHGRVACQPVEALRFKSWSAYERTLVKGLGPKEWTCVPGPNGMVSCYRRDWPAKKGPIFLYDRRAPVLPELVEPPVTFLAE